MFVCFVRNIPEANARKSRGFIVLKKKTQNTANYYVYKLVSQSQPIYHNQVKEEMLSVISDPFFTLYVISEDLRAFLTVTT